MSIFQTYSLKGTNISVKLEFHEIGKCPYMAAPEMFWDLVFR